RPRRRGQFTKAQARRRGGGRSGPAGSAERFKYSSPAADSKDSGYAGEAPSAAVGQGDARLQDGRAHMQWGEANMRTWWMGVALTVGWLSAAVAARAQGPMPEPLPTWPPSAGSMGYSQMPVPMAPSMPPPMYTRMPPPSPSPAPPQMPMP